MEKLVSFCKKNDIIKSIKIESERLKGGKMALFIIAVIYVGYRLIKEWLDDVEMRNIAKKNGWGTYPSSTGLKYTDTNEKYYGSKRYYKENIYNKK